jgi:hypothetical protein
MKINMELYNKNPPNLFFAFYLIVNQIKQIRKHFCINDSQNSHITIRLWRDLIVGYERT